jgi:hypothetical protein
MPLPHIMILVLVALLVLPVIVKIGRFFKL